MNTRIRTDFQGQSTRRKDFVRRRHAGKHRPAGQERVLVNVVRLDEAIRQSGKSQRELCETARIDPRSVANWRRGRHAYRTTLQLLAGVLGIDVRELIDDDSMPPLQEPGLPAPRYRKIVGKWIIEGGDIESPPFFEYLIEPRPMGGHIQLRQDDNGQIFGEGIDHDQAPLRFRGQFIGPDHFRGQYDIEHPRMSAVSGVLVGKLEMCGTKVQGFYLGRETGGYGQDFLLGNFTLKLAGSRDE
jgi:transcriptional regulator with XRE-family HTH domain